MDHISPRSKNKILALVSYSQKKKENIFRTVLIFGVFYIIFQILNPFMSASVGRKPLVTNEAKATATYTTQQVATHHTNADCWIIVSGQVYDITALFGHHSGGDDKLITCGADSTTQFNSHNHSAGVLDTYLVGAVGSAPTYDVSAISQPVTKNGAKVTFVGKLPASATGINLSVTASDTTSNPEPDSKSFSKIFDITATDQGGTQIGQFGNGSTATIVLSYSDAVDTDTVEYWDGSKWSTNGISNVAIDTTNNTATFTTTHFSQYAILSEADSSTDASTTTDSETTLPEAGANTNKVLINILEALGMTIVVSFAINRYKSHMSSN